MMERPYQPIDFTNIRDVLSVLFKRKYIILATFAIVFTGFIIYALMVPKAFEAKSTLLVKLGREFMRAPEGTSSSSGQLLIQPETIMKSEISILTSRDLIERVIETVGLKNIYPAMTKTDTRANQAAVYAFEEDLNVTNVPSSGLIQVAFSHRDPATAANVVNTLVDNFKDKHLDVFGQKTTAFLERQEKAFQERLKQSEGNLSNFKLKNKVFAFEEQKANLISTMGILDKSLKAAQNEITELEQKMAFVKSPRWTIDPPGEIRNQLVVLQQKEQGLLERYTETSRAVEIVRHDLKALRDSVKRNNEEVRQIEIGKIEGQLTVARARAGSIKSQMGQVEAELHALDSQGLEFQTLKREAQQLEQNYQIYARKLEESLISDDMDRQKMVAVSIVQKATVPAFPKKQKFSSAQLAGVGFFGGIAAGIFLAIVLEFLSPGMPTPASAEKALGVPVLISVMRKQER
jgi:polysaccharide biosynthesis protein PslE